ncbi:MAG: NAD(P)H-hydrate dehydratase [Actinobacteria bacterium]|nr:NAD(P)H-hydrate dehydratase [Actinomycetota bacterium]
MELPGNTELNKPESLKRILSGRQMAEVDREAISGGIDSRWLMKNAGQAVSSSIIKDFESRHPGRAPRGVVVCGGGNNGGDGFVAAEGLSEFGCSVKIFHLVSPERFTQDSRYYYDRLSKNTKMSENIFYLGLQDEVKMSLFMKELAGADFVVDAILGTGIHEVDVRSPAGEIIDIINSYKERRGGLKVYAVDIPSGIDSDNGKVLGTAVKADRTITFGAKKIGNVNYPGAGFNGDVICVDIGIPDRYFRAYENIYEPGFEWACSKIPLKLPWIHKHRAGKLLVVAGSTGFTGAAAMTCMAALRSGAGLVTLVCPDELNQVFEQKLTEVITHPLKSPVRGLLQYENLPAILELGRKADAVVIGPGISRDPGTMMLVKNLIEDLEPPVVLDADGLQVLKDPGITRNTGPCRIVITPHSGELSDIMGLKEIRLEDRIDINKEAVLKFGLVSVLKGARSVISNTGGKTYINTTGNWGLASAGTGDILAGMIGSLICQGMGITESAVCGTYIHGMAADIMAKKTSMTALIATDLLEGLKEVFLKIEKIKY